MGIERLDPSIAPCVETFIAYKAKMSVPHVWPVHQILLLIAPVICSLKIVTVCVVVI